LYINILMFLGSIREDKRPWTKWHQVFPKIKIFSIA
jgi:hypothetical protein